MMSRRGEQRKGIADELPRARTATNEAPSSEHRVQRTGPESVRRRSFRPNDRVENRTADDHVASIRRRAHRTSRPGVPPANVSFRDTARRGVRRGARVVVPTGLALLATRACCSTRELAYSARLAPSVQFYEGSADQLRHFDEVGGRFCQHLSGGALAKAVTDAGGPGLIGLGYGDQDWLDWEFLAAGNVRTGLRLHYLVASPPAASESRLWIISPQPSCFHSAPTHYAGASTTKRFLWAVVWVRGRSRKEPHKRGGTLCSGRRNERPRHESGLCG
jgi:hypothetical protein